MEDISLLERKRVSTPHEYGLYQRKKGPVFWWNQGKFWVVTDHGLAQQVLRKPQFSADRSAFFISRMPNLDLNLIADFFGVISKMMVMSDGKQHTGRRRVAGKGFSKEWLDSFQPRIEASIDRLLKDGVAQGRVDFVNDIAIQLPSVILADMFSIREEDRAYFYKWSNNMTQFFGGSSQYRNEDGVEVNDSACRIRDYFRDLIAIRRQVRNGDFLDTMLENQRVFGLTDDEVVSQAVMMLVAGSITTTDQLCNNMYTLLVHPEAQAELRANPELIAPAMEEFNRWDPAVTYLFRVASEDVVVGEKTILKGDTVFLANHAINRDPAQFENADQLQLGRSPNPHFAFGHGPHICLGAPMARRQMIGLFRRMLAKSQHLELAQDVPVQRKHHSLAFSGFEALDVKIIS